MWQLIRAAPSGDEASQPAGIPKVVVQYWHDSTAVPDDVRQCLDSWRPLADQGFERVMFDDRTARKFIAGHFWGREVEAFDRCPHPAMRCDYFRLCYIVRRGGFYVDADDVYQGGDFRPWFCDDMLKMQPLCYDTNSDQMVPADVFTAAQTVCAPGWILYVNNNPLIAPAAHPVIELALARSTEILLSHTGGRYDIQSTTGPGNLTSSLVKHSMECEIAGKARDFALLGSWEEVSSSKWPLGYRNDERNWRLWKPGE
jgi:mannosyltransferase OCH1-like enzyme